MEYNRPEFRTEQPSLYSRPTYYSSDTFPSSNMYTEPHIRGPMAFPYMKSDPGIFRMSNSTELPYQTHNRASSNHTNKHMSNNRSKKKPNILKANTRTLSSSKEANIHSTSVPYYSHNTKTPLGVSSSQPSSFLSKYSTIDNDTQFITHRHAYSISNGISNGGYTHTDDEFAYDFNQSSHNLNIPTHSQCPYCSRRQPQTTSSHSLYSQMKQTTNDSTRTAHPSQHSPKEEEPPPRNNSSSTSLGLSIATIAASYLWIGPLVVVYWCYTWHLIDYYAGVWFEAHTNAYWVCAAFGHLVFIAASVFQSEIFTVVSNRKNIWTRRILSRLYTYIMAFANVSQWLGIWTVQDEYLHINVKSVSLTLAVSAGLLLLMRCYRSTLGPPVVVWPDWPLEGYFTIPILFETKRGSDRYTLDSILSVVLVNTLVITVWRTTWEMMDLELYPDDSCMSGIVTLAISYSLALVLAIVQYPLSRLSSKLDSAHWLWKLLLEDVFVLLQSYCQISHWRGFWVIFDHFDKLRPGSLWVCHVVSFLLLMLSMAAQTLVVKGCHKDGELKQGDAIRLKVTHLPVFARFMLPCWKRNRDNPDS